MTSYPYRCKTCKEIRYSHSLTQEPGQCYKRTCEFSKLTNICLLVKTPLEPVTNEIGTFSPEKFPVVYTSGPNQVDPNAKKQDYSTACGAPKFPMNASDQVNAVTCQKCLEMASAFNPIDLGPTAQAQPIMGDVKPDDPSPPETEVQEDSQLEFHETFKSDTIQEDLNPFKEGS